MRGLFQKKKVRIAWLLDFRDGKRISWSQILSFKLMRKSKRDSSSNFSDLKFFPYFYFVEKSEKL